ncbi:MAG: class I SAM-dependent methyltransferase [Paracoccaceae bacterium]
MIFCRFCSSNAVETVIDLGCSPIANAYVLPEEKSKGEIWWPLHVVFCRDCLLVQTVDTNPSEVYFTKDYGYFSSYSSSWLAHAKELVSEAFERFAIDQNSFVVEVAANDGYLLQYVVEKGVQCLGVEPTDSTAAVAESKGIEILRDFFCTEIANKIKSDRGTADIIFANNVLAHVPDLKEFVSSFATLLSENGVAIFEFAHVRELIKNTQFDTIYHEHYSYLSLLSVSNIFRACGLEIFDATSLPTHGGSLRIFAQHRLFGKHKKSESLKQIEADEIAASIGQISGYKSIGSQAQNIKFQSLKFLIDKAEQNKIVVGYGAAAKGNTFLNYLGVRNDLIQFVVDRSPGKVNKLLPGSNIPILSEDSILEVKPDYIVLLPWNLRQELSAQLSYIRDWGGKLVVFVPDLEIF